MATVYIAEFSTVEQDSSGPIQIAVLPPLREQTVPITVGSVQSAPFGPGTLYIRVRVDAGCSIVAGRDPTATTSNLPMATNDKEYFGVNEGDKLAVIANP